MKLTKNICVKFCDELLDKFIIPDKKVQNFEVFCNEECKDIVIKISTEENEYNFTVNLIKNNKDDLKNINHYRNILIEEDVCVAIRDVSITDHTPSEVEVTTVANLKYVLGSLAFRHAKSINKNYFKNTICREAIRLHEYGVNKIQDLLCEAVTVINAKNIDQKLLMDGIENLVKESILKPVENLICVPGYSLLDRKVFHNNNGFALDNGKCKIINSGYQITLPMVYDMLLTIFHVSNQKLRQHHLHELTKYYYCTLEKEMHNLDVELATMLSPEGFEKEIDSLLRHVKLEIAYNAYQKYLKHKNDYDDYRNSNKTHGHVYKMMVHVAISELYECFLYPKLNRDDCYKIIENKIGHRNYTFLNWEMIQLEERPGFLGDYFKLKIEIELDDRRETFNLFAKYLATTNDLVKDLSEACFQKEVFLYCTFLTELKSLGLEELLDFLPKCYLSKEDVLIFEDLTVKQYKCLKKNDALSYENMRLVIKQIAKFHACSILYEEMLSKEHGKTVRIEDKYNNFMKEINLRKEEPITSCGMKTTFKYILDAFPDIPKKMAMEKFKHKVQEAYDSMFKKIKKCDNFRNVICQGDFWASNILFKIEDNSPVDCCIIDYQLLRYCPPTHDLLFLIYVNSDKKTRNKYMGTLIEEYYLELSKIIKRYNFDLNNIYSYQQFLECCEYMKSAAICIASLYLPLTMCPDEKIQDILTSEERATKAFSVDRIEMLGDLYKEGPYRQRVREIVEDLYDVCESGAI